MVAQLSPPLAQDAPAEATPLSAYSTRIDRRLAAVDDGEGSNRFVPIVHHEAFVARHRLSKSQRVELDIKQAALRLAAGLEDRSLRTLAKEIGCQPTAIDNALSRLCERIGLHKFLASRKARANLSEARRQQT